MQWNRYMVAGGLLGAFVVAAGIVFYNWGATPRLQGAITDVRTLAMDASSSVAIVNFQSTNVSNYEISIRNREIAIVDADGNLVPGRTLSVFDIRELFKYFPALGGMRDEPLVDNIFLEPGESLRGLAAARFEIPKHELDTRREIVLHTSDVKNRKTAIRRSED